jgi:hypothetical protein
VIVCDRQKPDQDSSWLAFGNGANKKYSDLNCLILCYFLTNCTKQFIFQEKEMSVMQEYLAYKNENGLKTGRFEDRKLLQEFLRDRVERIWTEGRNFSNGGFMQNYMTGYAFGFAYYDCRQSPFCKERCYGLPLNSPNDYPMFSLSVLTSESFKTGDIRYMNRVREWLKRSDIRTLKIGHWGDATPTQIPYISQIVSEFPQITFWWYTRKKEIAIAVNKLGLKNLKCYLSLDPTTDYPDHENYQFGITYLIGDGFRHEKHDIILKDDRLVAIFPLKKGKHVEDPRLSGIANHPKLCIEKELESRGEVRDNMCLNCIGRCNYDIGPMI